MKRSLQTFADHCAGRLIGADHIFGSVSSDSRNLERGNLFVALKGPHFDGNDFVSAALDRGAVGAVVTRKQALPLSQILVADALVALQSFATAWRRSFSIPVIGVAGSNGKTTTKEMIAAILSREGLTLSTQGNLNNHIGVPLTLARLEPAHRSAVIELGADRIGEVAQLVRFALPTVGLITNAGAEHLEFFGDLDGVAKGEGEMVAGLDANTVAVINADDRYADYWRGVCAAQTVLTFGVRATADFSAQEVQQSVEHDAFVTRFVLVTPQGRTPVVLHTGGEHNIANALAAAAAAMAAGARLGAIAAGLASFTPVAGRLQLKPGLRQSWLIDDSYNANPSSVRAGLDVLRSMSGTTWLVLGDMAELGEHSDASHAEIGSYARTAGVTRLFATGPQSSRAVEAFGAGAEWFPDAGSLLRKIRDELTPGVTVLIKGSRINRLEKVVKGLTGN
jgi:UDP-N-acetylmuramoyl-tripeptide--D-alanyl-D-alanine ligase